MVASFASNLIFLNFWCQNQNPTSFSWSLAWKVHGWPKISKNQSLTAYLTFYQMNLKLPFSNGNCDHNVILILLGYLEAINMITMRISWFGPKIPVLPLCIRWNFIRETLIFTFSWINPWGNLDHMDGLKRCIWVTWVMFWGIGSSSDEKYQM